jgi:hypothetical protein
MTMSMVGPYLTTTNYKKRRPKKLTATQSLKLEQEWRAYNKRMRSIGCHSAQFDTLEQYRSYVRGEHNPTRNKAKADTNYKPAEPYRREQQQYPSHKPEHMGPCLKKERPQYTGDLIVGIGTMHKSNAVPIMRGTEQAKEIAAMRR